MTPADKPRFAKTMATVAVGLREEIGQDGLEVYFAALSDLSIEQVERAATQAIRTCRFFPRPAELRELATNTGAAALEAYARLLKGIRRIGSYGHPSKWSDDRMRRTVEILGGWRAVCAMPADDLRKSFVRIYEQLPEHAPPQAPEIAVQVNRLIGQAMGER